MKLILIATLFFGPSFFAYSADLGETAPAFSVAAFSAALAASAKSRSPQECSARTNLRRGGCVSFNVCLMLFMNLRVFDVVLF